MKIVAWIVLGAIVLVLLGLAYYLSVGAILFKLAFARKNIATKYIVKDTEKRIIDFKIDLSWWDKVKFSRVETKSVDGLVLSGQFHQNDSNKTAIVFHGFGGTYSEMQQYCKFFHDRNFSVLAVDMRAHGQSEGDCIGYGWLDKEDVASWVKFINEKCPNDKIVLFGLSMGGSAVCMSSSKEMKNVVAIISDCAFSNANKQFEHVMRDHKFLLNLIKKHLYSYTKRLHNFDVMHADAVGEVKNSKYPILFIHGQEDNFVSFENLQILFDAAPKDKREKFVVENAAHAVSYPVARGKYEKAVESFLAKKTNLL